MEKFVNSLLNWMVKIAGVIVTAPATYEAAQRFAVRYKLFTVQVGGIVIDPVQQGVEVAAVLLVEGLFLLGWIRLDLEAQSIGLQTADVLFAWAMFGVIFSIAVVQAEVTAVIVRIPIAVALAYRTWAKLSGLGTIVKRWFPQREEDPRPFIVRAHATLLEIKEAILYGNLRWRAFKSLTTTMIDGHREVLLSELALRKENALKYTEEARRQVGLNGRVYDTTRALSWLSQHGVERTDAWLREKARSGNIGKKVQGTWLFSEQELESLLAENRKR